MDEEDDYFDRTDKKSKRGGNAKKIESKEVLQEKLAYKKKMLSYYEQQLKACEATQVVYEMMIIHISHLYLERKSMMILWKRS